MFAKLFAPHQQASYLSSFGTLGTLRRTPEAPIARLFACNSSIYLATSSVDTRLPPWDWFDCSHYGNECQAVGGMSHREMFPMPYGQRKAAAVSGLPLAIETSASAIELILPNGSASG